MKKQEEQKKQSKKKKLEVHEILLPAFSAVVVIIVSQIAQVFTNDWSRKAQILFSVFVGIAYLLAVTICALIIAICNASSKGKDIACLGENLENSISDLIKFNSEIITVKNVHSELNNVAKNLSVHIDGLIKSNELLKYILDGKSVFDLEASVGSFDKSYGTELEIYIQTSEFILEDSGDLFEAIMWNLRKGIKYVYMIPENKTDQYKKMLRNWFHEYSRICYSKKEFDDFSCKYSSFELKKYKEYWSSGYTTLYNSVKELWQQEHPLDEDIKRLRKKCEELFKNSILTCMDNTNRFYVTIALYEIKKTRWEAIVKLPTQDINEEYYAFKIPGGDKGNAKRTFINNCKSLYQKEIEFSPSDSSTYGGKYQIDFENEIFKWEE